MRVTLAVIALVIHGCAATSVFECERDEQCGGGESPGVCEPEGFCSFADPGCPSGRRFDRFASAEHAGLCVAGQPCIDELVVGDNSLCAQGDDGAMLCWGRNHEGQLTDALANPQLEPAPVPAYRGAQLIAIGSHHSCAVDPLGAAACAGRNDRGQLGSGTLGPQTTPVLLAGLAAVSAIAVAGDHGCAVETESGAVYCWGRNTEGQAGGPSLVDLPTPEPVNTADGPLAGVTALSLGTHHSCAVAGDAVYCWGENKFGEVGDGSNAIRPLAARVDLGPVRQIAIGADHSCALLESGQVTCWGRNHRGQLGDGTLEDRPRPVAVTLPAPATQLVAGKEHTCALAGRLWCWGKNIEGQLGEPLAESAPLPRDLGLAGATRIFAGGQNLCVMFEGAVLCRGGNKHGQLASSKVSMEPQPDLVGVGDACP